MGFKKVVFVLLLPIIISAANVDSLISILFGVKGCNASGQSFETTNRDAALSYMYGCKAYQDLVVEHIRNGGDMDKIIELQDFFGSFFPDTDLSILKAQREKEYGALDRESSAIDYYDYDYSINRLYIRFANNSRMYEYCNVPVDVYTDFLYATSQGRFYHSYIKGIYDCW